MKYTFILQTGEDRGKVLHTFTTQRTYLFSYRNEKLKQVSAWYIDIIVS